VSVCVNVQQDLCLTDGTNHQAISASKYLDHLALVEVSQGSKTLLQ